MRYKKLSAAIDDIKKRAAALADEIDLFSDGVRCLFIMYRTKDGGHNKEKKRVFDFEAFYNKEELVSALERFLWKAEFYADPLRIYVSVNKRDIKKSIRTLEERLLDAHYTDDEQRHFIYKEMFRFPRTYLMQPENREGTLFLIDVDDKEGRDVSGEALTWCSENNVEVITTRRTLNGWHIITTPFNPANFPKDIGGIHKDGLLFVTSK